MDTQQIHLEPSREASVLLIKGQQEKRIIPGPSQPYCMTDSTGLVDWFFWGNKDSPHLLK